MVSYNRAHSVRIGFAQITFGSPAAGNAESEVRQAAVTDVEGQGMTDPRQRSLGPGLGSRNFVHSTPCFATLSAH